MLKKSININKDEDAFVHILTLHMYSVKDFERSVGKKSINTNTAIFDLLYNIFDADSSSKMHETKKCSRWAFQIWNQRKARHKIVPRQNQLTN